MQYGVYSDIWSLGLSLVEVATGGTPVSPATYAEHTPIGLTGSSYPVPLGFPAYPYRRFQTVFDQLQTIVHGDLPKLPGDLFSPEAVDFCARWYARPLVPRRCHRWATHPTPPRPRTLTSLSPSLPLPLPSLALALALALAFVLAPPQSAWTRSTGIGHRTRCCCSTRS